MSYQGRLIELSPSDDQRHCWGRAASPSPSVPSCPEAMTAALRGQWAHPCLCLQTMGLFSIHLLSHFLLTGLTGVYRVNLLRQHIPSVHYPWCKNEPLCALNKHHRRNIFLLRIFKVILFCGFMVDIYIDINWLTKYNNLYEIKLSSSYLDASVFSAPLYKSVGNLHMQFSTGDRAS